MIHIVIRRQDRGDVEEEDVSSYWITLMKGEDTGHLRGKHWIALFGELSLEEAMDLS
jgi:hypothetical protein